MTWRLDWLRCQREGDGSVITRLLGTALVLVACSIVPADAASSCEGPGGALYCILKGDFAGAAETAPAWAAKGESSSAAALGYLYVTGQGMPYLPATGLTWLIKAAEQNNLYAFFWLGQIYDAGTMFTRDPVQALAWYVLATRDSPSVMFPDAMVAARDKLAKELTSEQRAKAHAVAAKWLFDHPTKNVKHSR